jgi:hypothetical protein
LSVGFSHDGPNLVTLAGIILSGTQTLEFLVPLIEIIGRGGFGVFDDDHAPLGPIGRQVIDWADEPILKHAANHRGTLLVLRLVCDDDEIIVAEPILLVPVQMRRFPFLPLDSVFALSQTTYTKVCSLDLASLEGWAHAATEGGVLDPCPTCQPGGVSVSRFPVSKPWAVLRCVDEPPAKQEILARFTAAVEHLERHFAGNAERLADDNAEAEMRRWLDGADAPLDWAGQEVTADEWFFITTLYGQRTRNQQRLLIRNHFPRFVRGARRDVRNLTSEVTRDWVLDQVWMKPRLLRMGTILRERGMTMQGYVDHLRRIDARATPEDPMPALDTIVRDHRATGWKTLSVFVRDCVGGHCFPIDSRVRKELERHGLPSGVETERLLVSLSLAIGRNPRQVARMFYEAGGVGGDFST